MVDLGVIDPLGVPGDHPIYELWMSFFRARFLVWGFDLVFLGSPIHFEKSRVRSMVYQKIIPVKSRVRTLGPTGPHPGIRGSRVRSMVYQKIIPAKSRDMTLGPIGPIPGRGPTYSIPDSHDVPPGSHWMCKIGT